MIAEEKAKLLTLLRQGKTGEVLEYLQSLKLHHRNIKKVDALTSQYSRLKKKEFQGLLSFEQANIAENQIVSRIIDLINRFDGEPPFTEETSDQGQSTGSKIWQYITGLAVLIGILGSLAEVFNFINVFPSNKEVLQLTVFVTDTKGNVVLENEGRLNIPLGNRSLNEVIGTNGRTNFPDITGENKGDTIVIGLHADGWEIADKKNIFVFTGEPIHLKVKKDASLRVIKGIVRTRNGQEFIEGVKILINADTVIYSDKNGLFNILLPEQMQVEKETDGYKITATKEGYKTTTQYYYPKSTPADIRLENDN